MYLVLTKLTKATTVEKRIGQRAQLILAARQGCSNQEIAEAMPWDVERRCVGRWRKRWQDSFEALLAIQLNEFPAAFERAVMDVLRDAHRSGAPGKFTAEQIVQLVSIACEPPRHSGRPVDDWTGRELADELRKRSIVEAISVSRVNELLREMDLQPHKRKCWCFTTEKNQELFEAQVQEVCDTYLQAETAYRQAHTHTVCTDEMTSLQANEQRADEKLPRPGQSGKRECQYTRHGTLSLTGSWHVVQGQMIHTTIDVTRNGQDFADHIEHTIQTDPSANWIFVMDNLNTHSGQEVVRRIAQLLDIPEDTLGDKKKRRGILGSTTSRRAFLCDRTHRIRFVFLPKHSSWLNQIEVVFGVISKRVMRHGSFTSLDDLKSKLLAFIQYFNQTFARPFNWTYTGRPTPTAERQRPRTWREHTQNKKFEQILALVA
jgi:transposase